MVLFQWDGGAGLYAPPPRHLPGRLRGLPVVPFCAFHFGSPFEIDQQAKRTMTIVVADFACCFFCRACLVYPQPRLRSLIGLNHLPEY